MDAARLHKVVDEQIRRLKEQGIVVPENFRTKLKRDVIKNYASNYRLVSRTTLESIIRMCKLWKPYLASEEDLTPEDYITYTSTPDKNISYYDSTLKKIYTLKNNQNKNH